MIKGKKVILRPIEERDLPLIVGWRNDPENQRYFFSPFLINPGGQKKWYEDLLADRNRFIFMIDTLDGKTVGMIGSNHIDWRNQAVEAGQLLIDPAERGKDYVEEATYLMTKYAFEELNLRRVYGYTFDFSPAIELYKFVGMKIEGVLRKAAYKGGKFHDVIVLGLLKEDWERDEREAKEFSSDGKETTDE